jgi:hypothetical protein
VAATAADKLHLVAAEETFSSTLAAMPQQIPFDWEILFGMA